MIRVSNIHKHAAGGDRGTNIALVIKTPEIYARLSTKLDSGIMQSFQASGAGRPPRIPSSLHAVEHEQLSPLRRQKGVVAVSRWTCPRSTTRTKTINSASKCTTRLSRDIDSSEGGLSATMIAPRPSDLPYPHHHRPFPSLNLLTPTPSPHTHILQGSCFAALSVPTKLCLT